MKLQGEVIRAEKGVPRPLISDKEETMYREALKVKRLDFDKQMLVVVVPPAAPLSHADHLPDLGVILAGEGQCHARGVGLYAP